MEEEEEEQCDGEGSGGEHALDSHRPFTGRKKGCWRTSSSSAEASTPLAKPISYCGKEQGKTWSKPPVAWTKRRTSNRNSFGTCFRPGLFLHI